MVFSGVRSHSLHSPQLSRTASNLPECNYLNLNNDVNGYRMHNNMSNNLSPRAMNYDNLIDNNMNKALQPIPQQNRRRNWNDISSSMDDELIHQTNMIETPKQEYR
eukprot:UN33169